jgi:DNA-binding response OmpR family regulator
MPTVVLIDDEHGPMDYYVAALQEHGFDVAHLDTVQAALDHIEGATKPPDVYILDIMMPPGDALDLREAGYGLTSGLQIHKRIRARFPKARIIVLTSISNPSILKGLPLDEYTECKAKIQVLPFELAEVCKGPICRH